MRKDLVRHDWTVEDYNEYCREKVRICQRKRRKAARTSGNCIICCCRQARPGRKTCGECSERMAAREKLVREMKKEAENAVEQNP